MLDTQANFIQSVDKAFANIYEFCARQGAQRQGCLIGLIVLFPLALLSVLVDFAFHKWCKKCRRDINEQGSYRLRHG